MKRLLHSLLCSVMVCSLLAAQALPADSPAGERVMKSGELHKVIVKSSEARQANLVSLEGFLAGEMAQKALRSAGMDPVKVTRAIHLLNDEEIADLAARAAQVQDDFAAGEIGDRTMLYVLVIVGIGTLVAFLIILP